MFPLNFVVLSQSLHISCSVVPHNALSPALHIRPLPASWGALFLPIARRAKFAATRAAEPRFGFLALALILALGGVTLGLKMRHSGYNSGAMIDKAHLQGKQVAFRLVGLNRVSVGIVRVVETDGSGFWIEAPQLLGELQQDSAWAPAVSKIQTPVLFVPTSSLTFLVATQE